MISSTPLHSSHVTDLPNHHPSRFNPPSSQEADPKNEGKKIADETVVKLLALLPCIEKMDSGLSALSHVTYVCCAGYGRGGCLSYL